MVWISPNILIQPHGRCRQAALGSYFRRAARSCRRRCLPARYRLPTIPCGCGRPRRSSWLAWRRCALRSDHRYHSGVSVTAAMRSPRTTVPQIRHQQRCSEPCERFTGSRCSKPSTPPNALSCVAASTDLAAVHFIRQIEQHRHRFRRVEIVVHRRLETLRMRLRSNRPAACSFRQATILLVPYRDDPAIASHHPDARRNNSAGCGNARAG